MNNKPLAGWSCPSFLSLSFWKNHCAAFVYHRSLLLLLLFVCLFASIVVRERKQPGADISHRKTYRVRMTLFFLSLFLSHSLRPSNVNPTVIHHSTVFCSNNIDRSQKNENDVINGNGKCIIIRETIQRRAGLACQCLLRSGGHVGILFISFPDLYCHR